MWFVEVGLRVAEPELIAPLLCPVLLQVDPITKTTTIKNGMINTCTIVLKKINELRFEFFIVNMNRMLMENLKLLSRRTKPPTVIN